MADVRNKSRQDRLRAALRENLKRRKQQAKDRATGGDALDDRQEDPAGIVEDEVSEAPEDQPKQSR